VIAKDGEALATPGVIANEVEQPRVTREAKRPEFYMMKHEEGLLVRVANSWTGVNSGS
jgi:hypothetical protein